MLNRILLVFFVLLSALLLVSSANAFILAELGLNLWLERMIPTLLPFMILSSVMTGLDLQKAFCYPFQKVLRHLFSLSENEIYCIIIGFLCGFPMGAFCSAELCCSGKITKSSAQTLVAFCNNIGPIYFFNFALGMIGFHTLTPGMYFCLFLGMYGIPLLYGGFSTYHLHCKKHKQIPSAVSPGCPKKQSHEPVTLLEAVDHAISRSGTSALRLCGYMVLFNVLMLPFYQFGKNQNLIRVLHCFMEISGGLQMMQKCLPAKICFRLGHSLIPVFQTVMLTALSFGGLSCIGQTSVFLQEAGLSVSSYVKSRICIAILAFFYYVFCFSFGFLSL